MHPRLALALPVLALALLPACRSTPLALPPPIQLSQPRTDMREVILRGMQHRGWALLEDTRGRIRAQIAVRAHRGTVDIFYTATRVSFAHVSTQNLDESRRDGQITVHTNYNSWLQYLRGDIERELFSDSSHTGREER